MATELTLYALDILTGFKGHMVEQVMLFRLGKLFQLKNVHQLLMKQ